MFQAEIRIRQHKPCIVSELATRFDTDIDVAIEELHDELVTFLFTLDERKANVLNILLDSEQVKHAEELEEGNFLVTKTSCGAYSAVDQNHGILRRQNVVGSNRRTYTVLFLRRQDLRAMIEDFRRIGHVTLEKVSRLDEPTATLTDRQHEVIQHALAVGYFEWPREVTSEELAAELGITRATLLEHLRKAESKLLTGVLNAENTGKGKENRPIYSEPTTPLK